MKKWLSLVALLVLVYSTTSSQVIINEGSCKNYSQITDSYGDNPDWIELYNAGNESVNLSQYSLTDNKNNLRKWIFPSTSIPAKQWLMIFASGRSTNGDGVNLWESAVREEMTWQWINPDANTGTNWMRTDYDDSQWQTGIGGFGFADGDDNTVFEETNSCVYTRIKFSITDTSSILTGILHVDFDDGFVAYLNGEEIARSNISNQPTWDSFADGAIEALMYQGQLPTAFPLDMEQIRGLWKQGENVLAVECHNASTTSSDMSLRVFLSFGMKGNTSQFGPTPDWFNLNTDQGLHTNFKISGSGETIYLSNSTGQIIDSLAIPQGLTYNYSFGSKTDGSIDRAIFINGTPGASNNSITAYSDGYEPSPEFSVAGGIYNSAVSVTLSTLSTTAKIRYTTDGSRPTATSALYTAPISVNSTKVLKAACFSTGNKLPSPIATNTYFINIEETDAPILSITMNNEDLYGANGIYDNWSTDWKKPCYIEFFEADNHKLAFKQNSGIKIDGGAGGSRSNPQHSFRVEPGNGSLGDGNVKYKLIPSKPDRESFETFYIRNGSNQYLYYPCKDAIETRCMGSETNNSFSGYTPIQVYLNGEYWGYYELREKIDEDFFKQHYGINEDSLELLSLSYWYGSVLRSVQGENAVDNFMNGYQQYLGLDAQADDFWEQADKFVDMEYYTDYICAQTWIADTDWPFNNIKIHRSPETGNRWRFSLVDLEWSLRGGNSWTDSWFDHINYMLYYDSNCIYVHIWQKAMENEHYRNYFINRLADLMNSSWKADRLKEIANEIYDETRPELPSTFERWGNGMSVNAYMNQFDAAHELMLTELASRSSNVRSHVLNNFGLNKIVGVDLNIEPAGSGYIKLNTIQPNEYPWTGIYFDGVPVKIEAVAKAGYKFDHWDANVLLSNISNAIFEGNLTNRVTFNAHFIENADTTLVTISEINYNSESSIDADDWIELWNFSTSKDADISGWKLTDDDTTHVFTFPANTVLKADHRLVVVRDEQAFTDIYNDVDDMPGLNFGLGSKSDAVRLINTDSELVAEVFYADSLPWPIGAGGQGRTMELLDPHSPTNDPTNWFDGCIGGSPGKAYTPCGEPLVFSEINYNSYDAFNTKDWVELRNTGNTTIDLSGWKFMDDQDSVTHEFYIPDGTKLAPQQNIVLAQDLALFKTFHSAVSNVLGSFNFSLSNGGEWIRMYDKSEKIRLSVRYNDKSPWPKKADGDGYTLELIDSTGIMNDGKNWFAGCYGGSPGEYYSLPCKLNGIDDSEISLNEKIYPNPFNNELNIDFEKKEEVLISLIQFNGQIVFRQNFKSTAVKIVLNDLQQGLYLLNIHNQDGTGRTYKIIKQ